MSLAYTAWTEKNNFMMLVFLNGKDNSSSSNATLVYKAYLPPPSKSNVNTVY